MIHCIVYVHSLPETDDFIFDRVFYVINCFSSFRNFKCVPEMCGPGFGSEDTKRKSKDENFQSTKKNKYNGKMKDEILSRSIVIFHRQRCALCATLTTTKTTTQ